MQGCGQIVDRIQSSALMAIQEAVEAFCVAIMECKFSNC